jgi:hypothetical protein
MLQKKSDPPKTYQNKHLIVPIFHNESAAGLEGFTEGKPGDGRIVAVKSVLYSDGSAKRWYRMAAVKAKKKNSKREKRVSKK